MHPVNWSRLALGGLIAGVVINASEYLINGVLLAQRWADAMRSINHAASFSAAEIIAFIIWGFLTGMGAVWLYASIRDHYGPGIRSAIYAALAVWFLGDALGSMAMTAMNLLPRSLIVYAMLSGLVEILVGTIAAALLYEPARIVRSAHA